MELSYDLHIHSCLSPCGDDDATPGSIAGMAALIGLDVIALTDHNTCRNCPTFLKAAEAYGVAALPGMELTTAEEIHVLYYFRTLEEALAFDSYVAQRLLPIRNRPKYFGNQILVNDEDEPCGTIDTLLISATDIGFDEAFRLAEEYHAVAMPAHIDKSSTSLLSQLGMIPPESTFRLSEITSMEKLEELKNTHPYLQNCTVFSSSDAHRLDALQEPVRMLQAAEKSGEAVFDMMWSIQYGK